MNKIIAILSLTLLSFMPAYAGVNIGASMNAGVFHGTGQESENGELSTEDATGAAAYASIFVEAGGERFAVGIDYVPGGLSSETAETVTMDDDGNSPTATTNKVAVDFEDLTTFYVGVMLGENFYIKGGATTVEVVTNENLGTGGAYGNTDLDGQMFGVGYVHNTDNGAFVRVEGNYLSFDSQEITNTNNSAVKVKLKNLDGLAGKISIGKSF